MHYNVHFAWKHVSLRFSMFSIDFWLISMAAAAVARRSFRRHITVLWTGCIFSASLLLPPPSSCAVPFGKISLPRRLYQLVAAATHFSFETENFLLLAFRVDRWFCFHKTAGDAHPLHVVHVNSMANKQNDLMNFISAVNRCSASSLALRAIRSISETVGSITEPVPAIWMFPAKDANRKENIRLWHFPCLTFICASIDVNHPAQTEDTMSSRLPKSNS